MSILSIFTNHSHYWGIPHERSSDNRMIQTCYECGAERVIKINLRPYLTQANAAVDVSEIKAARA